MPRRFPLREVEPSWRRSGPGSSARCAGCARPRRSCRPRGWTDGGEVPYLGERLDLRVRVDRRARGTGPPRRRAPRGACGGPGCRRARRSSAGTGAAHARRWRPASTRPAPAGARRYTRAPDPRPAHALGVLLLERRDELQLAAAAGARRRSSTTWWSTRWRTSSVLDHSERFWSLLAGAVPDWRERERWLRRHGHALRL